MPAVLSVDGLYRYRLSREWGGGPSLAFIMLNPSTADADIDDRTIRRCMRFARGAGYDSIVVGNLFGWRATKPVELKTATAPVGPDNDTALAEIIAGALLVICAWGARGTLLNRDRSVLRMIGELKKVPYCLAITSTGHPAHPLYLPAHLRPIPFLSRLPE